MEKMNLGAHNSNSNQIDDIEKTLAKGAKREAKPKYYHTTDRKHRVGDIVEGFSTNSEFKKPVVFLTDSEKPHVSLRGRDLDKYSIYRVVPLKKVKGGRVWGELATQRAKVVEVIGPARNFANKNAFSTVTLRDFNHEKDKQSAEYYKELNKKSPNHEGGELLRQIKERYG